MRRKLLLLFAVLAVVTLITLSTKHLPKPSEDYITRPFFSYAPRASNDLLVSAIRPDPNQLKISDLERGQIVIAIESDIQSYFLILGPVYYYEDACYFEYIVWKNGRPSEYQINRSHCTDFGLIPYDNHLWNAKNYLLPSEAKALTQEEMEMIISMILD